MDKRQFDEVVRLAIEKEREAVEAYRTASGMVDRPSVRKMLLGLAAQEDMHRRRLESLDVSRVSETALVDVPDLKISELSDGVTVTADMDYQDVLVVAMKREQNSHDLYSKLASNTDDAELKSLFELLSQEEAAHKLALEREYDEHVLTQN